MPSSTSNKNIIGTHVDATQVHVTTCDDDNDGVVTWVEFLRGHALDIIIARPNKSNKEVQILIDYETTAAQKRP